jgi:hypothetical protein
MLTTCPHCGKSSPSTTNSCIGCGRDLYRLADPPNQPPLRALFLRGNRRLWVATGVALLVVGAGVSSGLALDSGGSDEDPVAREIPESAAPYQPGDPYTPSSPDQGPKGDSPSEGGSDPVEESTNPPSGPPSTSVPPGGPSYQAMPPQFRIVTDRLGFSLGVPEGWVRQKSGDRHVEYVPPTGEESLRIGVVPDRENSAFKRLQKQENAMGEGQDYERVQLTRNTFQEQPGAFWEYTSTSSSGERMRTFVQAYIDNRGTEYSIRYQVRDRLYDANIDQVFSTALNTFKALPKSGNRG